MTELPLYKSNEFNINFRFELKNNDLAKKFKKDGELTSKTKVKIEKCSDYHYYLCLYVIWERRTAKGKDNIQLMAINPSDGFLEFLDKFTENKRGILLNKYWVIDYGSLVSACNFCDKDQEEFKRAVRKVMDINELVMLSGFRD